MSRAGTAPFLAGLPRTTACRPGPEALAQRGDQVIDVAAGIFQVGQVGAVEADRQPFGDAERRWDALIMLAKGEPLDACHSLIELS